MPEYKITRSDGQVATLTAARYVRDGSGDRFYDEDGNTIASFPDGDRVTVVPAGLTFGPDTAVPDPGAE